MPHNLEPAADQMQRLIRAKGNYAHVSVKVRAGHLNVQVESANAVADIIARATPIGASEYGLSFRNQSGRWEPLPVTGSIAQVVEGIIEMLGPFLDPSNL